MKPLTSRFRAILAFMRVEIAHLLRDRTTLSLVALVPAIQIILFGYAARLEPRETPVAIAGAYGQAYARRVVEEAGGFRIVSIDGVSGSARRRLEAGEARIAIELPSSAESRATNILVEDAELGPARAAAARLERAYWRRSALDAGAPDRIVKITWRHNPDARADWNIAPGLIGVIVMISMLLLGALAFAKERERGSWPNIALMPVATVDVMIGKLAPYLVIGIGQVVLALALTTTLFALPTRAESAAQLIALAALLAAFHLFVGFGLSALARSQLQAVQIAVFFYLPNMLLSGFLYPFEAMPHWAQMIGAVLPLTHYIDAARGLALGGARAGQSASAALFLCLACLFAGAFAAVAVSQARRDPR